MTEAQIGAAFQLAAIVLLFLTLIVSATTDMLKRKVYDWTTFPAAAFGLTLAYAAAGWGSIDLQHLHAGSSGLIDHLAGLGLGFFVFFVAYWSNGVGGGDVKLMAAVGAIMGLQFIIGAMFWSALIGAVFAIWALVWKGRLGEGVRRSLRYAVSLRAPGEGEDNALTVKIPYGVAISFGSLLCWFLTELPKA